MGYEGTKDREKRVNMVKKKSKIVARVHTIRQNQRKKRWKVSGVENEMDAVERMKETEQSMNNLLPYGEESRPCMM